jgi:hypothetical protein
MAERCPKLDFISTLGVMVQVPSMSALTIGQLEASFPLYCKALRILIRQQKSFEQIQRSVCWDRLCSLHHCLPRQYKDPHHLYSLLKREVTA